MIRTDEGEWYSASDLLNWLGCHHRTTLDARVPDDSELRAFLQGAVNPGALLQPDGPDGETFKTPAQARGDQHERAMLARLEEKGHSITRIERPEELTSAGIRERADETLAAMQAGVDVVFQAALLDAPWYGFADFLVRVDGVPSALGDYAYEVRDTKLARHPSANALIQMAHYGAIVEGLQVVAPPSLVVWLGTGEEFCWPYADAAPYLLEVRDRFIDFRTSGATTQADPVAACAACRWAGLCEAQWGAEDLLHVHRLSRRQRLLLRERGIETIASLATAPESARPPRMATATFERLQEQAAVQTGSAGYALIRPQPASQGLASIPPPDPGDIYFDLEGDPFAGDPTLDYLWAYSDTNHAYHHRWAHTADDERAAFAWFMALLQTKDAVGGDWHLYHYNTYEITTLKRVALHWPDEGERAAWIVEVDRLVAARFVDLYRAVEIGLRTQHGSTSLKIVEKLAGYDRTKDADPNAVAHADDSIVAYEQYVMSTDEAERATLLRGILEYNTHDVRATHAVHLWLRTLASQLGDDDLLAHPEPYEPSAEVLARVQRTADLRDLLGDAAQRAASLPSGISADGAVMLAHILEWHRAETVVQYLDVLRLKAWALDGGESDGPADVAAQVFESLNGSDTDSRIPPGTEHESCLLDVEFVREIGPKSNRAKPAIIREYRCRPGAWKVKAGSKVEEALPADSGGKPISFLLDSFDAAAGIFTFSRREKSEGMGPLVLNNSVNDKSVWESLMRLGESALSAAPDPSHRLALDLLDRTPPLPAESMQPLLDEDASTRARRLGATMTRGLLPDQGPPGTGKTWLGAHLIADAIKRGGRKGGPAVIAITANSHRVINNLMREAMERCATEGVAAQFMHVGGAGKFADDPRILRVQGGGDLVPWVEQNTPNGDALVIGATKYAWARPEVAGVADVLLIDEAGQLPLADTLAVGQCAPVAFALGDPQQLAAPVQAAHDESVDVSTLDHLIQGRPVMPHSVGVFLDVTYRMHPAVCRVVADLAYEGELHSSQEASHRSIGGPALQVAGMAVSITPGVAWIPLDGPDEEVDTTVALVGHLLAHATVTLPDGTTIPLSLDELLVVAPHNAHVNRLAAALPDGMRVGTVDRFQGQQGHVVVYSMGRIAESPGDVPFLYELNRLNVALSRARLMAIVVSQREATFPPVASPEHLMLASRFIRAVSPANDGD